jgi:hypothetical protein
MNVDSGVWPWLVGQPRRGLRVGVVTLLALVEAACASRGASGVSRVQPHVLAPETAARTAPILPHAAGGASNTVEDSGGPELLPWLVGRWKGKRKTCWPLTWNQPDELLALRRNRCDEAGVRFELELTFTEGPGKLDGLLEAVGEDGARHAIVAFVIAREKASCSLVWNEGGSRYVLEPMDSAPACLGGDLARFSFKRGPRSRIPYPIGIQLWLDEHELKLRRLQGPQHGAAVDQIFEFER